MSILEIVHRWADVQSSHGCNYLYPTEISPYMKSQYCGPAVYRWMVWTQGYGLHAYYVGETAGLADRIQQYVRPGSSQATNLRLKAYFDEAVSQKQRVDLQTLVFEPFRINNAEFSMELLRHTHIRRTLENLVLVWLSVGQPSSAALILNRVLAQDKQRTSKQIDAALGSLKQLGLTDEQTARLLETLRISRG